jgi:hypothetical protein
MIIKRINKDKTVSLAGEIVEIQFGFDEESLVDENLMIDENVLINDEDELSSLLQLFLGIESVLLEVDQVRLMSNGYLCVGEFIEAWSTYSDQEVEDIEVVDVAFTEESAVEDFFEVLFGIQHGLAEVDAVRIDSKRNYFFPEVTENVIF